MLRSLVIRFPLTSMVGALVVWALYFVLVYALVGLHCERPFDLGRDALRAWLLASTLVALGAALAIGAGAWATGRRALEQAGPAARRQRFMAAVAALVALLATISILLTALPLVLVAPCTGWSLP
jgi:hypothetical protein